MSELFDPSFLIAIIIAISVHEWAHAAAANALGDPTAKYEGRLTLNPLSHLDPIGTLMFFLVRFGWGKPVPVDPRYFKKPKRDICLVAAAGPASNLVLAIISLLILMMLDVRLGGSIMGLLSARAEVGAFTLLGIQIAAKSLFINLALMAFNLLPIAPLDGSKILQAFIPLRYQAAYEEFLMRGPTILLMVLLLDYGAGIPILSEWVFGVLRPAWWLLLQIQGVFV